MTSDVADITAPDTISIRRWATIFIAYLIVMGVPAFWLLGQLGRPWMELFYDPGQFHLPWQQVLKLLIFAIYLSVCSVFTPLPTGWLVAAIATREVALAGTMSATAVLVATAGALGSMMANINDYHLMTLMLRSRKIAAVRRLRMVRTGSRWFTRAPFTLVLVFNIIPIPLDIIRMLAAATRYPLGSFALANFLGRFIRYAVMAAVTYALNISALAAAAIMLAVASVLAGVRVAKPLARHLATRRAC